MNEPSAQSQEQVAVSQLTRLSAYFQKTWIHCLLLSLLGFIVRVPALQGQLVWDDDYLVRTNPFIKSPILVLEAFRHYLFLDSYSIHYRPVQNISYMADYFFWNGNFYGFHFSSVLYHVGSGLLLYLLLRRLLDTLLTKSANKSVGPRLNKGSAASMAALLISLLWMVHPVHSAAVDYVSGRADSLAFFFSCGAWLLFLKGREVQNRAGRITVFSLAWFSGLLGLCSRETACIWVVLFLVYFFAFERPTRVWRKWAIVAACLLMVAAYVGLRQLPGARPEMGPSSGWPASLRVVLMFRALGDYGRLLAFPSTLHMERSVFNPATFHSEKVRSGAIELEYLSIAGLALAAALVYAATRSGEGQRIRIFGAAWFLLAFLPISNLIDLNATVAEHWLYLPSVGFIIFLAGCALDLPQRWCRASIALACAAVLALGTRSIVRSSDWISNETFARNTIGSGGASVRIALLLAQTYSNRGDYVEAEKILRKTLQITPDYPIARNNLADVLGHQGKNEEAEALFADANKVAHERMKDYPRTWIAALNFAHLLHTKNDNAGAIAVLDKARHDYPQTWELISAEGELLRETNKLDAAVDLVRPFAQSHWWHYGAWIALGRAFAEKGDVEAADSALRHASWLDIRETAALNLIAMMRMRQNRLEEACQTQRRAVARQPDEPRQYLLLSNILDQMGRGEDARAALARVSHLRSLADSQQVTKPL